MSNETETPVAKNPESKDVTVETPWHSLVQVRHDPDRMFENLASPLMKSPFFSNGLDLEPFNWVQDGKLTPAIDVVKKDKEYLVTVEVPGMDEKDVGITTASAPNSRPGLPLTSGSSRSYKLVSNEFT